MGKKRRRKKDKGEKSERSWKVLEYDQIHNDERTAHIKSVTSHEWLDHFSKVLDCESLPVSDNEVENNDLASTFGPGESVDILDAVITASEVQAAIKALKDNKAAGPDGLSNDFF